jgi:beta-glucanase (GH16 family)
MHVMTKIKIIISAITCCFLIYCGDKNNENTTEPTGDYVPEGYSLVWADEFDNAPNGLPNAEWWFETGGSGWGNNEPQYYVDKIRGNDTVAKVNDGILTITAFKLPTPFTDSGKQFDIISARMNTVKAWKYGYFEARIKVPGGRGTWAAFWMMPEDFHAWPLDGEIDIMEYVGYRPDVAQASTHCKAYNHAEGNGKTGTHNAPGAERKFYTYGLLWTENEIVAFIDGKEYFRFENDHRNNKETWPFNAPFYLKLNLAIGGNWGGQEGIDPDIFPSRYEIDYVKVYQKK